MARKAKAPDAGPSKAYLVSFGDTMTALLAFFIVLNSLATEQTGANMYSGTGSFVSSFAKSGSPGTFNGNRSHHTIEHTEQAPIYALSENLDKNQQDGKVGPDDTDSKDRIKDRDKENFQKFLTEIERKFGLDTNPPIRNQVVFDSFSSFQPNGGGLSDHAIQLASEVIPNLRKPNSKLEIILWATMPSKVIIDKTLHRTRDVKIEIEDKFWLEPEQLKRIRYSVKPWLFSDAKRPVLSFVLSQTAPAN